MFREEGLYGWGVCPIRMPRAAHDIYSDRRKRTVKIPFPDRRKATSRPWRSSFILRVLIDDFPWGQAVLLSLLSFVMFISMYLINGRLPTPGNEEPSKPANIIISLLEEEQEKYMPPVQDKTSQSTAYERSDNEVEAKPVAEEPQKILEPEREKQSTYTEKQSKVPQKTLPDVRVKPSINRKPAKSPRAIAPAPLEVERRRQPQVITTSPARLLKYDRKEPHRNSDRLESDVVRDFVMPKNDKPEHANRSQRKYAYALPNHGGGNHPEEISKTDALAFKPPVGTSRTSLPETKYADERYVSSKKIPSSYPLQARQQSTNQKVSFQSERKEHSISETAKQPRSFSRRSVYSRSTHEEPGPRDSIPTFGEQMSVPEVNPPQRSLLDDPYVFEAKRDLESPGPQTEDQTVSFKTQEQKDDLMPVAPSRRPASSTEPRLFRDSSSSPAESPDFSRNSLTEEIDPSQLISLKEFKVCIDPQEEFRLKTQLAIRLDSRSWLESNGVVFFCKYPESGYTLQVDVYNPQGRFFKSRCEVLRVAIDAVDIEDQGVLP